MFVLGIDPGLTRTGYGIIEFGSGSSRPVAAGVIRTDPSVSTAHRLVELQRDLLSVLADHTVDVAAIEQVFVNRNRGTAMSVARASGVVMATLADRGIEVYEYTPSQMKSAITGSGSADKNQVTAVVAMRLGMSGIAGPPDVADALGVAICHTQHTSPVARTARR